MSPYSKSRPKAPAVGVGGKLVVSLFFLFFLGMGLLFAGLVAHQAWVELRTWTWTRTPCEILQSSVTDTNPKHRSNGDYFVQVRYSYSAGGQQFESDQYSLQQRGFSDYGKVEREAESYPTGTRAVCYVNPGNLGQAVLKRGSLIFPLFIFLPLIFVAIGGIGIYSTWRVTSAKAPEQRPISDRAGGPLAQRFVIVFFGLFMVVGLALCYAFLIRPVSLILSARGWPSVSCTIISSEVRSHSNNRGSNTYSINIFYSYSFKDRAYKANRYDFMGGSSSGYNGKAAIVSRYSPGATATCFVNPADPTQAVLERGFTPMMWLGFLPLLFFFAGLFGMRTTLAKLKAQTLPANQPGTAKTRRVWNDPEGTDQAEAPAVLNLQPKTSPAVKFVGAILISLFWNGIVSVFVFQIFKGWRSHSFDWFLALFMTPFVLIGLGMLAAIVYFFLALFNPRPRLTIKPGSPRLGESLRIEWEVSGRLEVLQNFKVQLEGQEEATYNRGTRTATDRNVFARLEVATTTAQPEMRSGSGMVTIPAGTMHSFIARHNKITWTIRVTGEIARWPDLQEEFNLTIRPAVLISEDL